MRKTVIALVAGLLALVWLTAGNARAKITTARITISGPGMTRTIEVTDLVTLQKLSPERLEDTEHPVNPPEDLGPGFTVIRYYRPDGYVEPVERPSVLLDSAEEIQFQREQGFRPIDQVRYHPDPSGGPGYIFYEHYNLNVIVPYEGNWYRATEVGEATIRGVLAENDVSPTDEKTTIQLWLAEGENRGSGLLLIAVSGGLLVLAGLLWRRFV
ncbi:MAG: hypothetical protein CL608_26500 [Anaerolineaceae bacterium]|nr:hypothetical protein [Anaerolineaceae bacterium]